jgi:hypothetical protein
MLGYVVINKETGLIVDALARTHADLRTVISCMVQSLHHSNVKRIKVPFEEVKGMHTPIFQEILKGIDYNPVNFQFAFAAYLLDSTLELNSIHASQWYMMPND